MSTPGVDSSKNEYREIVVNAPLNSPLLSIGALLLGTNLELEEPLRTIYRIKPNEEYPLNSLQTTLGKLAVPPKPENSPKSTASPPKITPDTYKFSDYICLAYATCFYLGNGLIATAGHCVFNSNEQVNTNVLSMKVVFGLSTADIKSQTIAAQRVFGIERVLFGQNVEFPNGKQNIVDRADWAILKLQQSNPKAILPRPLQIKSVTGQGRIDHAWIAGHPWGIGLTEAKPQNDSGYCLINNQNSLEHSLLTAPANSGGPIFKGEDEVIGLVTSGTGGNIESRGFIYLGDNRIQLWLRPGGSGTQVSIFSSLFQKTGTFFLACDLIVMPIPTGSSGENTITVKVLYGDGDDQTKWHSFELVNKIPISSDKPTLQLVKKYSPLDGVNGNPWQFNARALAFTYNSPIAAQGDQTTTSGQTSTTGQISKSGQTSASGQTSTGGQTTTGGRRGARGAGFIIPQAKNLTFGCIADGDKENVSNWTVLCKDKSQALEPGKEVVQPLPVFLGQNWNQVDGSGRLGSFYINNSQL